MAEIAHGVFFEKIDPEKHTAMIQAFDCGHKDTNEFIKESAPIYEKENLGRTYLIINSEGKVHCFVTIAMGALKFKDPELALSLDSSEKPSQLPALRIARLGTCVDDQGKGYGTLALQAIVKIFQLLQERIGARFIIVDAVPERVDWYVKRGFKSLYSDPTGHATLPLYLMPKTN